MEGALVLLSSPSLGGKLMTVTLHSQPESLSTVQGYTVVCRDLGWGLSRTRLSHLLSVWTPSGSSKFQGSSGAHRAENPQARPIKYIQAHGAPTGAPPPDTQGWPTQPLARCATLARPSPICKRKELG